MELTAEAAERDLHVSRPDAHPTAEEQQKFESEKGAIDGLQILSLKRHGFGRNVVAKVTFRLGGDPASAAENTCFYSLRFDWITGWRFPFRASEDNYRLAALNFR